MSCSCCCCVNPSVELLEGIRKKERLVSEGEEEEAGAGEGEESRRKMDISLLREKYRSTRERQRRHTQVLLFRTVSEELSEAVSIVPVTQGLTSPWEPNTDLTPVKTYDLDPMTYDHWHVHLGLHKRFCPRVILQLPASSSETVNTIGSSRQSSSSEAVSSRQDVESTSDSLSSSRAPSPFNRSKEDDGTDTSRGEPDSEPPEISRGAPGCASGCALEQNPSDGSKLDLPANALTSFDESSTPIASITCSPSSSTTSIHDDLKSSQASRQTSSSILKDGRPSTWRGSKNFSCRAPSLTRQLSVGGVGVSSSGVHQNQSYHPFPHRKIPKISEAARRLGMYSSL